MKAFQSDTPKVAFTRNAFILIFVFFVTLLGNSQTQDLRTLIKNLNDKDKQVRVNAAKKLGELKEGRAIEWLTKVLTKDKESEVRATAAWSLGEIDDPRASKDLTNSLKKDQDPNVRANAAEALGKIKDTKAVESLISALEEDTKIMVRSNAAWALGEIGDTRAIRPLITALNSSASNFISNKVEDALDFSHKVEDALVKFDTSAVEPLLASPKNSDIIRLLVKIKDPRAVEPLLNILKSVSSEDASSALYKQQIISALGEIKDARAADPLKAILENETDSGILREAMIALEKIGVPPAMIPFNPKKMLSGKDLSWEPEKANLIYVKAFDAMNAIAISRDGVIINTNDGGNNWNLRFLKILSKGHWGVDFIDSKNGLVVGENGTMYRTTDGGFSWTRNYTVTSSNLYSVSCSDSLTCTVVGEKGTILRTVDGGISWTRQNNSTTGTFLAVRFANKYSGVAAGVGFFSYTTNGGETWKDPEYDVDNKSLFAVSCFGDRRFVIVGEGGIMVHTEDGGRDWAVQYGGISNQGNSELSGTISDLIGVSFQNINTIFAVGGRIDGTIFCSDYHGSYWKPNRDKFHKVPKYLYSVSFINDKIGFVVGKDGSIYRTDDGGKTWKDQSLKANN